MKFVGRNDIIMCHMGFVHHVSFKVFSPTKLCYFVGLFRLWLRLNRRGGKPNEFTVGDAWGFVRPGDLDQAVANHVADTGIA